MTHRGIQYLHASSGLLLLLTMIAGWLAVAVSLWMLRNLRTTHTAKTA